MIRNDEYQRLLCEYKELEQQLRDQIKILALQLAKAQSDSRHKDYLIAKKEEECDALKHKLYG